MADNNNGDWQDQDGQSSEQTQPIEPITPADDYATQRIPETPAEQHAYRNGEDADGGLLSSDHPSATHDGPTSQDSAQSEHSPESTEAPTETIEPASDGLTAPVPVPDSATWTAQPSPEIPTQEISSQGTEPTAEAESQQPQSGEQPSGQPVSPYRPAPEYGAYGPVPTEQITPQDAQPNAQADTRTSGQQYAPQTDRNPYYPGNSYQNPNGYAPDQNTQQPYGTSNEQQSPFAPQGGQGSQTPQGPYPTRQTNGSHGAARGLGGGTILVAVVAALVSAVLCLGIGFAAISNGWVRVPTSNSLADVNSNGSGSGSAVAKSGEATDWTAVAKSVSNSVVSIQSTLSNGTAKGSGAIIDTKGYVVTNNHVISGATQIQVTLANGQMYSAQVTGTDTTTDIAVIKLDNPPSDLSAVEFANSDSLAVGENVMAIGNPLGYDDTATTGIVSALNRPVSVQEDSNSSAIVTNAVQIDAAINPGNSGGPTFNAAGQVIGINSSIASTATTSSEAGSIGIGFAIPSNLVKRVANEIIDNGSVKHVTLGVTIVSDTVTADGVTRGGAKITSSSTSGSAVVSGSPAEKAGLRADDTIVAFNGNAVNSSYSLLGYVRAAALNDKVKLTIVRSGKTMDVEVTLDQAEATSSSSSSDSSNSNGSNGNGSNGDSGNDGGLTDPFGLW